jgi:hypothetical protein
MSPFSDSFLSSVSRSQRAQATGWICEPVRAAFAFLRMLQQFSHSSMFKTEDCNGDWLVE